MPCAKKLDKVSHFFQTIFWNRIEQLDNLLLTLSGRRH
jgi:hypothetical protein